MTKSTVKSQLHFTAESGLQAHLRKQAAVRNMPVAAFVARVVSEATGYVPDKELLAIADEVRRYEPTVPKDEAAQWIVRHPDFITRLTNVDRSRVQWAVDQLDWDVRMSAAQELEMQRQAQHDRKVREEFVAGPATRAVRELGIRGGARALLEEYPGTHLTGLTALCAEAMQRIAFAMREEIGPGVVVRWEGDEGVHIGEVVCGPKEASDVVRVRWMKIDDAEIKPIEADVALDSIQVVDPTDLFGPTFEE